MICIGDVTTWDTGCNHLTQARKVIEEANEVAQAVALGEGRDRVLEECADTVQAACNLVARIGVEDFRPFMELCERRNRERGRL